MRIKWLGHASFLITSDTGTKIITDPYLVGGGINYGEIKESADIVTVSHEHGDHSNVAAIRGKPEVVKDLGTRKIKGIEVKGIPTYHDDAGGNRRGKNTMFSFEVDGIRVCHPGDLGHQLSDKQINEIGKIDILLIPVGGFFTIDAKVATDVTAKIKPKVIIPMHYKTDKCAYSIAEVNDFLKGKTGVSQLDTSETEFKKERLPTITQIVVLKPAL
ncbi:MBL fold metallo-hydrolase [Chloroflexota bacterium]